MSQAGQAWLQGRVDLCLIGWRGCKREVLQRGMLQVLVGPEEESRTFALCLEGNFNLGIEGEM